jgi:hypothetical protein
MRRTRSGRPPDHTDRSIAPDPAAPPGEDAIRRLAEEQGRLSEHRNADRERRDRARRDSRRGD